MRRYRQHKKDLEAGLRVFALQQPINTSAYKVALKRPTCIPIDVLIGHRNDSCIYEC